MKNFFRYVKEFGFAFAFKYYFCSMMMIFSKKNQRFRNKVVKKYLEKHFVSMIDDQNKESREEISKKKIWCFWWTGLETAPEIVKACVNNIKKSAKGCEVVVLDKNNIKDFVEIPQYIYDKMDSGAITVTHFSDILRMCLLSQHGVMWIDATIYYTGENLNEFLGKDFFTLRREEKNPRFISNNNWTGYFLACNKGNKLVENVKNLLFEYWKNHDKIIDYFLIDFFIDMLYSNNKDIKEMIDGVPFNNVNNEKLVAIMNEVYDEKLFKQISENTNVFKLTWKKQFLLEKDGQKTFYNYILNKDKNG